MFKGITIVIFKLSLEWSMNNYMKNSKQSPVYQFQLLITRIKFHIANEKVQRIEKMVQFFNTLVWLALFGLKK
jgi:hypothetical protein